MSDGFWHWLHSIQATVTRRKDLTKTQQKEIPLTHTCLAGNQGGKFAVPDGASKLFLEKYAAEILQIRKAEAVGLESIRYLYFNEYRTPVFRMMFDLDFIQLAPLQPADELKIYEIMNRVIRVYYPDLPVNARETAQTLAMFVTGVAEPKQYPATDPKRPNWVKIGRHGVFPYLRVNAPMAFVIREAWILALENEMGVRASSVANPWADVVDGAVYGPNGLRMVYSHKAEKCKKCVGAAGADGKKSRGGPNTPSSPCDTCFDRGYIDANREYIPLYYLINGKPSGAMLQQYLGNTAEAIRLTVFDTSLRLAPDDQKVTPGFQAQANRPVPSDMDITDTLEFKEDAKTRKRFAKKKHVVLENNAPEVPFVRRAMRALPAEYRTVAIKQIERASDGRYYHILLRGPGSTYCMNLGGCHRNNTAFFVIKQSGIHQRCHCQCTTLVGRKFGLCSKFESQEYALSDELIRELFPVGGVLTGGATANSGEFGSYLVDPEIDKIQSMNNNTEYAAVKNILGRLAQLVTQPIQHTAPPTYQNKRRRTGGF